MNNEIKEILKDIDNEECYYVGTNGCLYQDLDKEQLLCIKNYITNLQEDYENEIEENLKLSELLLEKQTRIYKAVEYIKNENNITKHGIYPNYTYEVDTKDLLDILQGSK